MMDKGTIVKVRLTYEGGEPYQSDAKIELIGVIGAIDIGRIQEVICDSVNGWDELMMESEGFIEATLLQRSERDDVFTNYWFEPIEITEKFYA